MKLFRMKGTERENKKDIVKDKMRESDEVLEEASFLSPFFFMPFLSY